MSSSRFAKTPEAEIRRSSFNRSHGHKTTFDADYLIPIFVDEALPGDTFKLGLTQFARLATPIKPVMDNMYLETFFFAVPNRLLWNNWKKFNGEQVNPGDSTDYTVPQITLTTAVAAGDLADYMGIPLGVAGLTPNALHFRAYNLIYNEWFRDENLINSATVDLDDGPDAEGDYVLRKRGKRHDYFTSCLPWPQKGTAVDLPLGTAAPVQGFGMTSQTYNTGPLAVYETGQSASVNYASYRQDSTHIFTIEEDPNNTGYPGIYADLSTATAATINDLREAFQVQRLYERDARSGTRYIEIIKSHFGVSSPDSRMQRPEYLGGTSMPINITIVPQTSESATTKQGNLAAFGTGSDDSMVFTKSFTEHCVLIGLAMVRGDITYQQGLNRMWTRQTRWDYYWPALAHLGEQAVLNQEIYTDGVNDTSVFGYQERYAEYKYKPHQVSGLFRSTAAGTLEVWHLAEEFGSLPTLNQTFIESNTPIDRVIATPTEPHFLYDSYFSMVCTRPMPTYSVPGLIDHF